MNSARIAVAFAVALAAYAQPEHVRRLEAAATVFEEVMAIPDKAIPQELLDKAHCVAIVPGLKKGAFIFGAKYGKGYFSCRKKSGAGWTGPATVRIEGGSFGLQIGGSETDVILLVMNERGAQRLLSSKFTLGGDASVAAGPVGRTAAAQTDAFMTAEILSWSRSRGVFAGVSLQGATLRQDLSDNRALYGRTVENKEIIENELPPPKEAERFVSALNRYSSRKG
ncbi:MAG: lipid-binding SYLF domain-containing protein [Bryobacterales bacterium]|nr:lipid-binding SYLF domain-containing protein [Bryobacteraceae bacterium]MDW8352984.1 lipid-binding SYLF domain-containing protein [Bryobacterales bacterium]